MPRISLLAANRNTSLSSNVLRTDNQMNIIYRTKTMQRFSPAIFAVSYFYVNVRCVQQRVLT